MRDFEIEILLATYNGEKYLREQLDSLINQTYKEFFVTVRDDGSTDGTLEILCEYKRKYPKIFRNIYENKSNVHGAKENFTALFDLASGKYIMFSDQDDVWCENKIEVTVKAMKKAENQYPDEAILVHTDMYVVDSELNITDSSFFNRMRIQPERNRITCLFTKNTVTGCTMMLNHKLRNIVGHIPQEAVMHDCWVALCASGMGHICTLYTPTMYYRQHENNTVGVDDSSSYIKWTMKYIFNKDRIRTIRRNVEEKFLSAKRFYADYANLLSLEDRELCEQFLHLNEVGHISQLRCICQDESFDRSIGEKILLWLQLIR